MIRLNLKHRKWLKKKLLCFSSDLFSSKYFLVCYFTKKTIKTFFFNHLLQKVDQKILLFFYSLNILDSLLDIHEVWQWDYCLLLFWWNPNMSCFAVAKWVYGYFLCMCSNNLLLYPFLWCMWLPNFAKRECCLFWLKIRLVETSCKIFRFRLW